MPEPDTTKTGLEKLKGFKVEEPTGLTALPDLPDPESPEFQAGELGKGIQIARAVSILLAGASDPNLASALAQQFAQQDLVARADAQERYKLALGRVEGQREEIAFNEKQREQRVGEQVAGANVQLDALNASLRAAELEFRMTEDPDKKQQLPVTIAELTALRDAITGEQPKPVQFKTPLDLIGQVPEEEISKALTEGTGAELVERENLKRIASLQRPKPILAPADFEALLGGSDPVTQLYARTIFSVAPDPRTDTFATQADSLAFGSALRGLAEHDPEAEERISEAVAQAWLAMGRVDSPETAARILGDAVHNNSDPKQDPRLQPEGTFRVVGVNIPGPPAPGPLERLKQKISPSQKTTEKIKKFTDVQGKQQFRR